MMKLFTSYYANYPHIPNDYYCIGISRTCPAWFKDNHLSNFVHYKQNFLAPSAELLDSFKAGKCTEDDYKRTYITDLFTELTGMGFPDLPTWIKVLEDKYKDWKGVVFMCYETPDKFCHRHLFRRLLKNIYKIPCEEFGVNEFDTYGHKKPSSGEEMTSGQLF